MKILIPYACIALVVSFTNNILNIKDKTALLDKRDYTIEHTTESNKNSTLFDEPYVLSLHVNKQEGTNYTLNIQMQLNNGAHYVSPNAKRDFKGKFVVRIDANDKFKQEGNLIEIPLSKEENDPHPFVDGLINWVRVNTTYEQQIKLTSNADFQVMGFIQFTIEPRCTLEKVPFIIKYENGEIKFELNDC